MEIKREFHMDADRYQLDFGPCSTKNGFAQLDTKQDAWYYGVWANCEKRIVVSYAEGDLTTTTCENDQEFVEVITKWGKEDYFIGIDPGIADGAAEPWKALGLGEFLHESYR